MAPKDVLPSSPETVTMIAIGPELCGVLYGPVDLRRDDLGVRT